MRSVRLRTSRGVHTLYTLYEIIEGPFSMFAFCYITFLFLCFVSGIVLAFVIHAVNAGSYTTCIVLYNSFQSKFSWTNCAGILYLTYFLRSKVTTYIPKGSLYNVHLYTVEWPLYSKLSKCNERQCRKFHKPCKKCAASWCAAFSQYTEKEVCFRTYKWNSRTNKI